MIKHCKICGTEFIAKRKGQVLCPSPECKKANINQKSKEWHHSGRFKPKFCAKCLAVLPNRRMKYCIDCLLRDYKYSESGFERNRAIGRLCCRGYDVEMIRQEIEEKGL